MSEIIKLIIFTLISTWVPQSQAQSSSFEVESLNTVFADSTLIDPKAVYPQWGRIDSHSRELLAKEQNCQSYDWTTTSSDSSLLKLREWIRFRCHLIDNLQPLFFESPPFLHPSGASYVALAWQMPYFKKMGSVWLNQQWRRAHLLEIRELIMDLTDYPPDLKIWSEFSPDTLYQLLRGYNTIILNHYQLIKDSDSSSLHYSIQERTLNTITDSPWFLGIMILIITILILVSIWLGHKLWRTRKQIRNDRELMMQTLAHELRHPVTSLQLSMEFYREIFDQLPSRGQDEFLRMTSQVQRLFRIIQASTQYLQSSHVRPTLFKLKAQKIESIEAFIVDSLADYSTKIALQFEGEDRPFSTDPYWLSTCILNLVKNSIMHGTPPITVKIQIQTTDLTISVIDQGKNALNKHEIFNAFYKRRGSEGLGLGLTIVSRIVELMNGELQIHENPTRFQFTVKEVTDVQSIAS